MVIPFFGKKPTEPAGTSRSGGERADAPQDNTILDFPHGDAGRALAKAAESIQVSESTWDGNAAIEEAAVLYANASDEAACAVLEAALDGSAGRASEHLWRMLLDLYRLTGNKTAFDARGVSFAQQFEISPPLWGEAEPVVTAPVRANSPSVNLSGNLSGNARNQLEQLARIGAKSGKLRIDMSRVRGIDEAGATVLMDVIGDLKRQRAQVSLLGAQNALNLVQPRLKTGERENGPFWHLALALLQQLGDQDRFDEVALDYAITFEESPPSYEAPVAASLTDTGGLTESGGLELRGEEPVSEDFAFDSVLSSANQTEQLRRLATYASDRDSVDIDAKGLTRLEFVAAGALFNQLAQIQAQGKKVRIHGLNALVAALMRVMGIDQIAQIELARR
ncbi:MAG: STAS domain-containing protein [Rhodocyclaceae bacterium]